MATKVVLRRASGTGLKLTACLALFAWKPGPMKATIKSGAHISFITIIIITIVVFQFAKNKMRLLINLVINFIFCYEGSSCLPCGHLFGLSCINKWLRQTGRSAKVFCLICFTMDDFSKTSHSFILHFFFFKFSVLNAIGSAC